MTAPSSQQITQLLADWSNGDQSALERLTPFVYEELRRMAHRYMRQERPGQTLQTTALVHEAYLRLVDHQKIQWQARAHFFAIAATLMRRILIDHARERQRQKRGGDALRVTLAEAVAASAPPLWDLLALDEALTKLEAVAPRKSRVVELRCIVGLSNEEIAEIVGVSPNTVIEDWKFARAWLRRELSNTA